MKKFSIRDFKPKKAQMTKTSSWTKNVIKSMGYSASDMVTRLLPATKDLIDNNSELVTSAIQELRNYRQGSKRLMDAFEQSPLVATAKEAFKNAKEDIRTGNLYNRERIEKMGADEFGMDEDFDFGDLDFGDDGGSNFAIDDNGEQMTNINVNATISDDSAMVEATEANTQAVQSGTDVINSTNLAIANQKMMMDHQLADMIKSSLSNINTNLVSLVTFNSESMSKLVATSISYQDESLAILKEINSKIAIPFQSAQNSNGEPIVNKKNAMIEEVFSGGFNLSGYGTLVHKQLMDTIKQSPLGMILTLLEDEDALKLMAANPLQFVVDGILDKLVPKLIQEATTKFDNTLKEFIPALLMKVGSFRDDYSNPFLSTVGKIFGINPARKSSVDMSKYEKGQIPFDGQTKKAIVDVIPFYLRKIHGALTGDAEIGMDWKKGTMRTIDSIKKSWAEEVKYKLLSGVSDIKSEMDSRIFGVLDFKDKKERDKLKKKLDEFFIKSMTSREFINVRKMKDKDGNKIDKLMELMSFDNQSQREAIRAAFLSLSKEDQMRFVGSGKLEGLMEKTKFLEQMEASQAPNNLFSAFGNNTTYGDVSKYTGSGLLKDKYKLSPADYLRDIRSILIKGIITFPKELKRTGGKKFGGGNIITPDHLLTMESKISREKDSTKEKRVTPNPATDEQIRNAYNRNRRIVLNSMSDLEDRFTTEQLEDEFRFYGEEKKEAEKIHDESTWYGKLRNKISTVINYPINFITKSLDKIDTMMYKIIFGGDNNSEQSFLGKMLLSLKMHYTEFSDWMKEKFFKPISEFIWEGPNSLKSKFENSQFGKVLSEKKEQFFDLLFGTKGAGVDGLRGDDGLLSSVYKESKLMMFQIRNYITGAGYTDPTNPNNVVPNNPNSIFGNFSSLFKQYTTSLKEHLFGKEEDGTKGVIGSAAYAIAEGFSSFGEAIFGKNRDKKDGYKIELSALTESVREKAPKALAIGLAGAGIATILGLGGGLLPSLFLPTGPIGGMITGTALGFATQSEQFMTFVFGAKGAEGRLGGLVSKKTQDFFKKHKNAMLFGATTGTLKHIVMGGGGLLGGLFGAPIAGAVLALGAGMLLKSEKFNTMMFGEEIDGKRIGGLVGKITSSINGEGDNKFGKMAAGAIGGGTLGLIASKFGLMGSILMGGGPIIGAMIGVASGLALTSEKWKKALFGEFDEDLELRHGGLFGKFVNWTKVEIFKPLKLQFAQLNIDFRRWFANSISQPFQLALDPVRYEIKYMMESVSEMFKKGWDVTIGALTDMFKETLFKPLADSIKNYLINPLKSILNNSLNITKMLLGFTLSAPFRMLSFVSDSLVRKHSKRGVKERRKEGWEALKGTAEFAFNNDGTKKNIFERLGYFGAGYLSLKTIQEARERYAPYLPERERIKNANKAYNEKLDREQEELDDEKRRAIRDRNFISNVLDYDSIYIDDDGTKMDMRHLYDLRNKEDIENTEKEKTRPRKKKKSKNDSDVIKENSLANKRTATSNVGILQSTLQNTNNTTDLLRSSIEQNNSLKNINEGIKNLLVGPLRTLIVSDLTDENEENDLPIGPIVDIDTSSGLSMEQRMKLLSGPNRQVLKDVGKLNNQDDDAVTFEISDISDDSSNNTKKIKRKAEEDAKKRKEAESKEEQAKEEAEELRKQATSRTASAKQQAVEEAKRKFSEMTWRQKSLALLGDIKTGVFEHGKNWMSMFGKKGLIALGLLALYPHLKKFLMNGIGSIIPNIIESIHNIGDIFTGGIEKLGENIKKFFYDLVTDNTKRQDSDGEVENQNATDFNGTLTKGFRAIFKKPLSKITGTGIAKSITKGAKFINKTLGIDKRLGIPYIKQGIETVKKLSKGVGEGIKRRKLRFATKHPKIAKSLGRVKAFGYTVADSVKNIPKSKFAQSHFTKSGRKVNRLVKKTNKLTKQFYKWNKHVDPDAFIKVGREGKLQAQANKIQSKIGKKVDKNIKGILKESQKVKKRATKIMTKNPEKGKALMKQYQNMQKTAGNLMDETIELGTRNADDVLKVRNQKLFAKISNVIDDVVEFIIRHFPKLGKAGKAIKGVLKKALGKISSLSAKMLNKLGVIGKLTKGLAKDTGKIFSGGILAAIFATYDGISGAYEVRRIFRLPKDSEVSSSMRLVAGLVKSMSNLSAVIGIIIDLSEEFLKMPIRQEIANVTLRIVSVDEMDNVEKEQLRFKDELAAYNEKNKTDLDEAAWNDKENSTLWTVITQNKVVKGMGDVVKQSMDFLKKHWWGESGLGFSDDDVRQRLNLGKDTPITMTHRVSSMVATIGKLLPTPLSFMKTEKLAKLANVGMVKIQKIAEKIWDFASRFFKGVQDAFGAGWKFFTKDIPEFMGGMFKGAKQWFGSIDGFLGGLFGLERLSDWGPIKSLKDMAKWAFDGLGSVFKTIGGFIKEKLQPVWDLIANTFNIGKDWEKKAEAETLAFEMANRMKTLTDEKSKQDLLKQYYMNNKHRVDVFNLALSDPYLKEHVTDVSSIHESMKNDDRNKLNNISSYHYKDSLFVPVSEEIQKNLNFPVSTTLNTKAITGKGAINTIQQTAQSIDNNTKNSASNYLTNDAAILNSKPSKYVDYNKIKFPTLKNTDPTNKAVDAFKTQNPNTPLPESYTGEGGATVDPNYFSQKDSRWSNKMVGSGNMGDLGCGPTSMAMIASKVMKDKVTPDVMQDMANKGGYASNRGVHASFISDSAQALGMKTNQKLYPKSKDILESVNNGPTILLGKNINNSYDSPYTTRGHYIVANKAAGGKISIQDPRGKEFNRLVKPDQLIGTTAAWDFEGAGVTAGEKVAEYMMSLEGTLNYTLDANKRGKINEKWGDCSSTCWYCYKTVTGIEVGRNTGEQLAHGTLVVSGNQMESRAFFKQPGIFSKLKPGDLVLYGHRSPGVHVEMYVGNETMYGHGTYARKGPTKHPCSTYQHDYPLLEVRRYCDDNGRPLNPNDKIADGFKGFDGMTGLSGLSLSSLFSNNNTTKGNVFRDVANLISTTIEKEMPSQEIGQLNTLIGDTLGTLMGDYIMRDINAGASNIVGDPNRVGEKFNRSNVRHYNLTKWNKITAEQLNEYMETKVKANKDNVRSPFRGMGQAFIDAGNATGLDPRYIFAHAAWESGYGLKGSGVKNNKNNYFGINAINSNPDKAYKMGNDFREGIINGAKWIKKHYTDKGNISLDKMIYNNNPGAYARDDYGKPSESWIEGVSSIMAPMGDMIGGGEGLDDFIPNIKPVGKLTGNKFLDNPPKFESVRPIIEKKARIETYGAGDDNINLLKEEIRNMKDYISALVETQTMSNGYLKEIASNTLDSNTHLKTIVDKNGMVVQVAQNQTNGSKNTNRHIPAQKSPYVFDMDIETRNTNYSAAKEIARGRMIY